MEIVCNEAIQDAVAALEDEIVAHISIPPYRIEVRFKPVEGADFETTKQSLFDRLSPMLQEYGEQAVVEMLAPFLLE